MTVQTPIALSLIVCDSLSIDRGNGKVSILGCFESVFAARYPCVHPEMTMFTELTDGRGRTPITVKFVRTTPESIDGELLGSVVLDVTFQDPFQVVRVVLTMKSMLFPKEGEYRIILETEGAHIAERRILAVKTP